MGIKYDGLSVIMDTATGGKLKGTLVFTILSVFGEKAQARLSLEDEKGRSLFSFDDVWMPAGASMKLEGSVTEIGFKLT